jgi:hypothetical protein
MQIISTQPTVFIARESNSGQLGLGFAAGALGIAVLYGSLVTRAIHPAYAPWAGLVFLAAAVVAVFTRQIVTLTLDKGTGRATLIRKSLLSSAPSVTGLDRIASVRLYAQTRIVTQTNADPHQPSGSYRTERDTSLLLVLKDGQTVDISDKAQTIPSTGGFSVSGGLPNQDVATAIAAFLGVPLEQNAPGQVTQSFALTPGAPLFVTPPPAAQPLVPRPDTSNLRKSSGEEKLSGAESNKAPAAATIPNGQ